MLKFCSVRSNRAADGPILGDIPTTSEIAACIFQEDQTSQLFRHLYTFPRNSDPGRPRFVPIWSSTYEPLGYPLLFFSGEAGWSKGTWIPGQGVVHATTGPTGKKGPLQYYVRQRLLSEPVFHRLSRVVKEWQRDMYSSHEEQSLHYISSAAGKKRVTTYRVLSESAQESQVGKMLPKSFHGHPAKTKANTTDALAVVARKGKPHLMLTMTCNGSWEGISQNLLAGQTASDRPDLCDRVFKIKLAELMKDLRSGQIFGPIVYEMYVIEFQKRGMPHARVIVKFDGPSPDQLGEIDEWCWAEIPPAEMNDGRARAQVLNLMVHRKYGSHNIASPCMQDDRHRAGVKVCGKKYPQPWRPSGTVNSNTGRAEYHRRETGEQFTYTHKVNGAFVESFATNQWIVPYNIWLLTKYNCHLCCDICTTNAVVKYLFKYINEGLDFVRALIICGGDELEAYRSARYISASEAAWRLLGFHTMERQPAVSSVRLHLPDEQHVIVDESLLRQEQLSKAQQAKSDLIIYLGRPLDSEFGLLTYLDYNEKYFVHADRKARKTGQSFRNTFGYFVSTRISDKHVARVATVSPDQGDVFISVCFFIINPLDHSKRYEPTPAPCTQRFKMPPGQWASSKMTSNIKFVWKKLLSLKQANSSAIFSLLL